MRNVGFIASSVSHVLVLAWGLVSLPAPKSHDSIPLEILPVDLVTLADVTDVKKGDAKGKVQENIQQEVKKAPEPVKQEPKKPAPKVEPKVEEAPAKPKSDPVPKVEEPKPEPKSEPAPKEEPKPEPVPVKEEAKPEPEAPAPKAIAALPKIKPKPPKKKTPPKKKAPEKKKRDFDPNALKALVNKADEAAPQKSADKAKKASFGSRSGNQNAAMTQSEIDSLRSQVSECWSPPAGAVDAGDLRIRLQFRMDRSGNVVGQPEILAGPAGSFGYAASRAAVRAVLRCAPYQLPADKYDLWKDTILNFDPSDMF